MPTAVIITAIICVTLIVICLIPRRNGKPEQKQEYDYHVVHVNVPRGVLNAVEQGIRTALFAFDGEVIAVYADPYYPDMPTPTYSIVIRTPKKAQEKE